MLGDGTGVGARAGDYARHCSSRRNHPTPVKLPENSPAGEYFISMSLMDGGNKFETKKTKLTVKKPGVSSFIFSFAHKFSFIYGVFSAIIAIALGVFASFVFRKR